MKSKLTYSFFISVIICFLWCPCKAQEKNNLKRFGHWFVKDPVSFFKDFGTNELIGAGLTGVTAYSLTYLDRKNSIDFQNSFSESVYLSKIKDTGQPLYAGAFAATVFGSSLLTDNKKFQDAAFTSLQAVIYNHITVGALKFAFSRARPRENKGPHDFDFFNGEHTSFPSGHTSTAFAVVTPWVMYYNRPAMYSLYAIPISVGIERLAEGDHWLSDVTTATIIGTYWGYYLSKKHMNIVNDNIDISPLTFGKGGGIHLQISF